MVVLGMVIGVSNEPVGGSVVGFGFLKKKKIARGIKIAAEIKIQIFLWFGSMFFCFKLHCKHTPGGKVCKVL